MAAPGYYLTGTTPQGLLNAVLLIHAVAPRQAGFTARSACGVVLESWGSGIFDQAGESACRACRSEIRRLAQEVSG